MNQIDASRNGGWTQVCALEDINPSMGVCALLGKRQVAVFRLPDDRLFSLDNCDPNSGATVLSRGIVGDLGGDLVVASPMYKHHYNLHTGECLEDAETSVAVYPVKACDGRVWVCASDD